MKIDSKALQVNLEETAVDRLEFHPKFQPLRDAVKEYKGVKTALNHLLFELHHPYLNWSAVIMEFRAFSLKNLHLFLRSDQPLDCVSIFLETFLDLAARAPREEQSAEAVDGWLAFLEKVISTWPWKEAAGLELVIVQALEYLIGEEELLNKAVVSYHSPTAVMLKLLELLERRGEGSLSTEMFQRLGAALKTLFRATYRYWLGQEDPFEWFRRMSRQYHLDATHEARDALERVFAPLSHETMRREMALLDETGPFLSLDSLEPLRGFRSHLDMVREYREAARMLGADPVLLSIHAEEINLYLLFLFHMVEMEGLSHIHEETLRELNRALLRLVRSADYDQLRDILPKSFTLLKQQVGHFPRTALHCIAALGDEVFKRDNVRIIELFLGEVVRFGFQPPQVQGVDKEWHVLANPAHLQNIRVWLRLIGMRPKDCATLLSALILHLKLGGTCIRDTDLFQKDVSRLLHCDIRPVYNLVKQFARQLPIYFNEIGAEGRLRDVSTQLDEISKRRDQLIHFLRKQSHVESSNLIVDFIENILCYWYSRNKEALRPFVPPEVLEEISSYGPYIDHVHAIVRVVAQEFDLEPFASRIGQLLGIEEKRLREVVEGVANVPVEEKSRFLLLVEMYRLESQKYQLGVKEIGRYLEEAERLGFHGLRRVRDAMNKGPEECLEAILDALESLKEVILSPMDFRPREDIYQKRHIAADIPSMYGRYHERKFDALGMTFRLENLANIYFERLLASTETPFITSATLKTVLRHLRLFWRAVTLNGVHSKKFEAYLSLLEKSFEVRGVTFSQYMDIVRGLSEGVREMIYTYYISPHQENIRLVLKTYRDEDLLPKYRKIKAEVSSEAEFQHQVSERILRGLVSGGFGLQYLDTFVTRLLQILDGQRERLDERSLDLLLSYDPNEVLCPIHTPESRYGDLMHLGNKGYHLVLLRRAGLPVPPGIIVTTEFFRCFPVVKGMSEVYLDFRHRLRQALRGIEEETGRRFGEASSPLLLSVRSGAAISMPGMMSTILNVGSTEETVEGLARLTGNTWFAWDNYRRFLQSWAMSYGMKREAFSQLMRRHKRAAGIDKKREFSGEEMKELALAYRRRIEEEGIPLVDDPFEQLLTAIELVLMSWQSEKARAYREIMGISDHWGTAVIIQAMTYGNLSSDSGTGVVFTANPTSKLDRVSLWGDFTPGNQGEDIVSGLVSTYPISNEQKELMHLESEPSLEEMYPDIYGALLNYAKTLIYDRRWNHQEIEFTFEGPTPADLYILQARTLTTKQPGLFPVFSDNHMLEKDYLGRGIGVSGGALSGIAVFTLDDIHRFRQERPGEPLILIRSDTVPDDIKEISLSDGLLTAKGGQTSHAAIVAFSLDKTCIVGCKQLTVKETRGFATIQHLTIRAGDFISIDGRTGSVYKGKHPIDRPEAFTMH